MKELFKNAIVGAIKTAIPTDEVQSARALRNARLKDMSISEKVNYKLHDKTTWLSIALIGFYAYSQNWGGVVTEILPLIGFDVLQTAQEVAQEVAH